MSEASSGRAAGGEPGGHETLTTGAVQLAWQCTNSVCRMELNGIPPNSLPLCPFCGKQQEGFSHRAPSNVSGPPQSAASQEEHSRHPEEPESSDVNISSSSTKANSGVEVNPPADDEASKTSGEDLPETPPNMCPKMDRAQDHSDSPEPGIEAVSSPQLPLAASAATPSSPSTELHPPSVPLPLPTGPSPLPPDGPPPSQTGPPLPMGGSPTSHPPGKSTKEATETMESLMHDSDNMMVGNLLSGLIRKKYPIGAAAVNFDKLLQWDLWPCFIKFYATLKMRDSPHTWFSCLPDDCTITCENAYSMLLHLCERIYKGEITLAELTKISQRKEHVRSLCAALSGDLQECNDNLDVISAVDQRMTEYHAFCEYREYLDTLNRFITIPVNGLKELGVALQHNYDSDDICRLCKLDDEGQITFPCFSAAILLTPMLRQFFLLKQKNPTVIFEQIWTDTLKVATSKKPLLVLADIVPLVWKPAFLTCKYFLYSLMNQSIKLADVDKFFLTCKNEPEKLLSTIETFNCGMYICLEEESQNTEWIKSTVYSIQQYWSMSRYSETAATLLQMRTSLNLTGDFSDVEQLATKVSKSMINQPLKAIDSGLIDAGQFLEESISSQQKLHCLETFIECLNIVEWLRMETKNIGNLKKIISDAQSTVGGEGDLAYDMLSNLRTVGSGFGRLIYDLKSDAGFTAFKDCCKSLWDFLKHTPSLPDMLRGCNQDLGWFKAVRDTLRPVEFRIMGAILEYGRYHVDSSTSKKSIHEIILVTLEERGKRLHKKVYTLEELRDLESKLVLITGSQAENREMVDLFLNTLHWVCRIAETLIALQQAGAVKYIGWSITIPCTDIRLDDLRVLAKEMEEHLHTLAVDVMNARKMFYELNYFTTVQLLMLRKELAQVKILGTSYVTCPSALTLLRSVSAKISADTVAQVVHGTYVQRSHEVEHISCNGSVQNMPAETLVAAEHASTIAPMPSVSKFDVSALSEKEKEVFVYLTEHLGFVEKLVNMALQKCGENVYECLKWCSDNDDVILFSDDEEFTESDKELHRSSDAELEEAISLPSTETGTKVNTDSNGSKIKVVMKELIDKSHPEVQKVHKAGYSLEQSIAAIKHFHIASAAIDYFISTEIKDDHDDEEEIPLDRLGALYPQRDTIIEIEKDALEYLSLQDLGEMLRTINEHFPSSELESPRPFSSLKSGQPNMIVTLPENVLKTVLALYMEEETNPLPSCDEVLICSHTTTEEEVTLLWRRAIGDPGFKRIFCLVHAEKLSYQVCNSTVRSLKDMSKGEVGYRVVIICSNEDEDRSHMVSKLEIYRRQFVIPDIHSYRDYLKYHFTDSTKYPTQQQKALMYASTVNPDYSCVKVVSSQRSGMGKSLYIRTMATSLYGLNPTSNNYVTIPIHGPIVTSDSVMAFLKDHLVNSTGVIFHIDVSPSVLHLMDTILFSLLILRGLRDSYGYVWRCYTSQLYAVEVTLCGIMKEQQCCLTLLDLLPTVECVAPIDALEIKNKECEGNAKISMNDEEFRSDHYQRVYQYLRLYSAGQNLDKFSYTPGSVENTPTECIDVLLRHCGIMDPSWSEICHFVTFLDIQLQSCEQSVFINKCAGEELSGLKGFVANFMIVMSKDFATSSLHGEIKRENREEAGNLDDQMVQYTIDQRKQWELNTHPYIFFNQDSVNITFVGFKVSPDGRVLDLSGGREIEVARMPKQLFAGLKANGVNFNEDYTQWSQSKKIKKIETVMGLESISDPDSTYFLTPDNLVKILAIHMRFRCNIPVVIMGETGCGKTRLIRFMCNLMAQGSGQQNMIILKVHGGIREQDIIDFVSKGIAVAEKNQKHKLKLDTVLFFDEANTTDAIGLIKEIMCDRRLQGCPLTTDIKFIAACNPYRKHTSEMILKLESARFIRINETQDKLGSIPLQQLVYRVLELPPSMRPLIYDFGQLNQQTEQEYSDQIVRDHVKSRFLDRNRTRCIAKILAFSQQYMRERKDECSFVSLRDVKRAMIVFNYFLDKMNIFNDLMNEKARLKDEDLQIPDLVTRSLVLAVGVCYHAKLQVREEFELKVAAQFSPPLRLPGGAEQFRNEIRYCQEVLLENMMIGVNIAKNTALRENIFMMVICIELRIPLFLVGKPGSSKSLAKSIIADSMRGKISRSKLLRNFKEVHMLSFQCSQLSTPEGIIEVFSTAKRFQKGHDTSKYVSVVVLDEVGLAEDSPNLPLNALHHLLEDGTEQSDDDEIIEWEERVAFIGISNWALDPAKMNRGVMVTRSDPDEEELELSARGICSFKDNDPVRDRLEQYFRPLAAAYMKIYMKQTNFFGLRDFYSLIKMLYWMCQQSGIPLTAPQLEHAIKRNFGGWEDEDLNPLEVFRERIRATEVPDLSSFPSHLHPIISPDCKKLGLITAGLKTKETTWHGENRYLLFLTENYAALDILRHYLQDALSSTSLSDEDTEPFILFGSSFPHDKEYTQVCRNINRIKICMETGRTVILLNLENVYESLYALLNQYYLHHGGQRYVDLGLQTLRVKCRVHNDFKLILIAEKTKVYDEFPTPLINRMEKHFVLTSSVLEEWQQNVLRNLKEWISNFSEIAQSRDKKFKEEDAFIGYQKDTPAAVIFQATDQLEKFCQQQPRMVQKWAKVFRSGLLEFTLDVNEEISLDEFQNMVLALSKYLMLQTAPEDAVIRLLKTRLVDSFDQQITLYLKFHHSTVFNFLKYHVCNTYEGSGQIFQVTTHSHLLSEQNVSELECNLGMKVSSCILQQFDTELDFTNNISQSFKEREFMDQLLIIQCDSGHMSGDLIACARYRVLEERHASIQRSQPSNSTGSDSVPVQSRTHVVFIIHLPKREFGSSFVGFQGDPWVCTHIDNLLPPDNDIGTPELHDVIGRSISELFYQPEDALKHHFNDYDEQCVSDDDMELDTVIMPIPKKQIQSFCIRLHGCIHTAVSRLDDSKSCAQSKIRDKQRVDILLRLIPKEVSGIIDHTTFYGIMVSHIHHLLKEHESIFQQGDKWVLNEAMDATKLQSSGTFRKVLARKLDEEMSRPFAKIIAFIDCHSNLNLLDQALSGRSDTSFAYLWLAIFGLPTISDLITGREVPGVGGRRSFSDFKCQFPFSWIVKQTFDDVWINAKIVAGHIKLNRRDQLCEEVKKTHKIIGKVLMELDDSNFNECYLHDFVKMVHDCHYKKAAYFELEFELVCCSLHALVLCKEFSTTDGHQNPLQFIASLHVTYHIFKSEITWFSQLTSCMPQILQTLKTQHQYTDSEEMILPLRAVECALCSDVLLPPVEKDKKVWSNWLTLLRQSQVAIDSILSGSAHIPLAIKIREKWQLTRVLQLFVEHVLLKHECEMVNQVRKLHLFLMKESDFLKAHVIEKVKRFLNALITTVKVDQNSKMKIKNSCRTFFMEVISSLCFGGVGVPEPELVKLLLDTVFIDSDDKQIYTRNLTPFLKERDSEPVIRTFVLQLLLEHSSVLVKEHLNEYFIRSSRALSLSTIDRNVCLLIVKCFEDNLYRKHATKSLIQRMQLACSFLNSGGDALTGHTDSGDAALTGHEDSDGDALIGHAVASHDITVEYLEGVAGIRFALVLVADILNSRISGLGKDYFTAQADDLLALAEKICIDTRINHIDMTGSTDTIGPCVYLLKLFVRQYGSTRLMEASKACSWVLPPQIRTEHNEVKMQDPFVIYNEVYSDLRQVMNNAATGKHFQELKSVAEALTPRDAPLLLLSLYQKATLSRASALPSKQLLPEILEQFEMVVQESKLLSFELKLTAKALIANQQGGFLGQMQVTPSQSIHCRVLGGVVIHTATVLLHRNQMEILLPFINMLHSPDALANAYLPTMPQDHLAEVREAGGTFYDHGMSMPWQRLMTSIGECPNGHIYYVGECGNPTEERNCIECHSRIGGIESRLRDDNKAARKHDTTQKGYVLGNPDDRSEIPTPERKLSSASCCIVRALMHCALVWTSCNNESSMEGLCQLVKNQRPNELPEFFWRHLQRDVELLGRAINKNTEECAWVLHLVLKNILTIDTVPAGDMVQTVNGLGSHNSRQTWEDLFNKTYVQPVLEKVSKSFNDTMEVVLNDENADHDDLFYLVYERVKVSKDCLIPHLWTYRARITLEHLSQTLQQQSSTAKYPILFEFLKEEPSLRATQYLPDIIRLQQRLYDCFHRRLDRKDASLLTIGDFLQQQISQFDLNQYELLIDRFKHAWVLVRDKLHDYGLDRLHLDEEYISQDIDDATPLEYLIPTATGPGACSMALTDFLTLTHNNFVLRCRAITNEGTASNFKWNKCEVPITHLHRCHLLDYEHQLLSIILSHCHYSLTLGKGEDVSYDLPALEKHILDRFIHGKPTILADIPQVVYRQDVYNAATFAAIRVKVKPQVRLSTQAQHEIISELGSMERLRDNLDVVEIVIGFLSSGGGRANKPLVEYIKTLKMQRKSFSKKAKEHCTLGHVLSLWEVLSVHLAKRLTLKDQEPFDTLPADYHDDITSDQKKSLDHCLGSFELSQLLGVLYEFLEVYVRHSLPTKEWPLVVTLEPFQDQYYIPLIAHFKDKFPPDISVAQTAATWKYIVVYQASVQGREARPE